jgi:class 3 adenylate cyclase
MGNVKRKISAILAADVAGYSKLVAEDEEETIRRLATYRGVFDDFVTRCGGRVFNTAGDAVLAEFPSSVDAVRCALEVQESFRTRNLAYPPSRHMSFRIGINIGDVIEREGDLLGDGVNVAARLESLAPTGGICISRSVYEQVLNKVSVGFEDIGDQHVKNIPNAVRAYVVALEKTAGGYGAGKTLRRVAWRSRWLIGGAAAFAIALIVSVVLMTSINLKRLPNDEQMSNLSTRVDSAESARQADLGSVIGRFDGLWEVSLRGSENCVYQTSDYRISVVNGAIVFGTQLGSVEATGDFHFTTPARANPNLTVRYSGRLTGDNGEGTYQVLGSKCGGTLTLKRFH